MDLQGWLIRKAVERIKKQLPAEKQAEVYAQLTSQISQYLTTDGLNISVLVDENVPNEYLETVRESLRAFDPFVRQLEINRFTLPPENWNEKRKQYNVTKLFPSKGKGQLRMYIINADMYAENLNWAYGITSPTQGTCVISIARFSNSDVVKKRGWTFSNNETRAGLMFNIHHEGGHLLGLFDHTEKHHVGTCAMNQTLHMHPPSQKEHEKSNSNEPNSNENVFCPACATWMTQINADLKHGDYNNYARAILAIALGQRIGLDPSTVMTALTVEKT